MKLATLTLLVALISAAESFSQNAIALGLVSEKYPLYFWDELASISEEELTPEWRRLILYLDRTRAGNDHWCCNHGRTERAKNPVYNQRGEVVAWNYVPCANMGCCRGYIEVANHCLVTQQLVDWVGNTHYIDLFIETFFMGSMTQDIGEKMKMTNVSDKNGQGNLLDALDVASGRLGSDDTADLIALIKQGGLIGK